MPKAARKPLLFQATTSLPLPELLPGLKSGLLAADAWIRHDREISPCATDLDLELHPFAARSFYLVLIRCGLRLSRPAHVALAMLCSREHLSGTSLIELRLELRSVTFAGHDPRPVSAASA